MSHLFHVWWEQFQADLLVSSFIAVPLLLVAIFFAFAGRNNRR